MSQRCWQRGMWLIRNKIVEYPAKFHPFLCARGIVDLVTLDVSGDHVNASGN